MKKQYIQEIKEYAIANEVPIMSDETLDFISKKLIEIQAKTVLELGTAIGYSSIVLAMNNTALEIDTVERDEERHLLALENIRKMQIKKQIRAYWEDIYDFRPVREYDALIIDAAKAQNESFYKLFSPFVKEGGIIIVDNMDFHGLTSTSASVAHRRNLKMMLEKIEKFETYIKQQEHLKFERKPIGDGLLIIYK